MTLLDDTDQQTLWADEVKERLYIWAAWTRGHQIVRGSQHVLAAMVQRAAGEIPGADSSVGYDFTPEIEVVDKAIARLKMEAQQQDQRRKKYMKAAKRVLMSVYLGQRSTRELAEKMDVSEDHVKALLWYAESFVGRTIPIVEKELKERAAGSTIHSV